MRHLTDWTRQSGWSFHPQTGALTLSTLEGATCILLDIYGQPAFFNSHLDAIKGQLLSSVAAQRISQQLPRDLWLVKMFIKLKVVQWENTALLRDSGQQFSC